MRSIIICEGSTDAILLSYYLNKVSGWEFCKKAPEHLDIKQNEFDQSINWYKRDDDRLLICGVGGKDKISSLDSLITAYSHSGGTSGCIGDAYA